MFSGFIIRLRLAFVLAACNSWISFSLGDTLVYIEAESSIANMEAMASAKTRIDERWPVNIYDYYLTNVLLKFCPNVVVRKARSAINVASEKS
jgi:hypothetical protein